MTPPAEMLRNCPKRNVRIAVEFRLSTNRHGKGWVVATVPAGIIKTYLPSHDNFRRYYFNKVTGTWSLRIYIDGETKAEEIEAPSLDALFAYMSTAIHSKVEWNRTPAFATISDGIKLYRGLQLLHSSSSADNPRWHVMQAVIAHPLTSYDVRCIWYAFSHTEEWRYWLVVMMCNLASFQVWNWTEGKAAVEASKIAEFLAQISMDMDKEDKKAIANVMQGLWN
ncbi:hypothetical protein BU23DRAFT_568984 [Bimuria novae-zelandiae CBS 107.79]|uniref:Uncharacterized protein n=1 Tax=Bimuria novae-zelandiae CBS 107.79 TaxID=1447943 RepID=A0A6A5V5P4_9PLEO|nr:hypothetical protein BU23DRAFT_568984 [Bimuria novae-zelandiae CBS 107.79]